MMLRHFLWLVVVLLSVAAPAVAGDRVRIFVTLPAGQPITIAPISSSARAAARASHRRDQC